MSTILAQIEAVLNSRPLYAINDENGEDALTPGHFLVGRPLLGIPSADSDLNASTLNKWKLIQKIQRDFWNRWKDEYLFTLQQRNKWKISKDNLSQGDIVVIKEENTHPARWPLARIIETHPGKDGHVRVVSLKLQNTTLKRPINKICPLVKAKDDDKGEEEHCKNMTTTRTHSPKPKRFLTTAMLLMILIILPSSSFSFSSQAKFKGGSVTELSEKAAIYLDSIGKMDVVSSTWSLVIYFDLESYQEQVSRIPTILKQIKDYCHLLTEFEEACRMITLSLEKRMETITSNDNLFVHNKRQRRAPLEFIGSLYNIIFGLMDADDQEQIENNFKNLLSNQESLKNRIKEQVSLVNSAKNIIKKTTDEVNAQFSNITLQIN